MSFSIRLSRRRVLPKDAWQGDYKYVSPAKLNITKQYDLYSFGKNGIDDLGQKDDLIVLVPFGPYLSALRVKCPCS